ncbi:MAG: hypothetical protein HY691_06925 [Chloroflexi bacterium]|nr:hypothetical protein [Chloroflexota bacterium]
MIIRQRGSFLDPLLLEYVLPVLWRRGAFWRYVLRWWNYEIDTPPRPARPVRVKS